MSKYKIVQNIVTKKYKIQQRFLWIWVDIFYTINSTKGEAENLLKNWIKYKEGKKKSNWKEV